MLFTDSSKIVFKMFDNLQLLYMCLTETILCFTLLWDKRFIFKALSKILLLHVESNVGAEQGHWSRCEQTAWLED